MDTLDFEVYTYEFGSSTHSLAMPVGSVAAEGVLGFTLARHIEQDGRPVDD